MKTIKILAGIIGITIVMFLFIVTIYSAFAYDSVEITTVNESSLPRNGFFIYNLDGQPNGTAFLNQIEFNDHINLTFPSNLTFGDTNLTSFQVNWAIDDFVVPEDVQFLNTSIQITNDFNNNSHIKGFVFDMVKESLAGVSNVTEFHVLSDGYNISVSQNLLPKSGNLDFRFQAPQGSKLFISNCGIWLTCPTETYIDTAEKIISIPYLVPSGTAVGFYDMSFNSSNNQSNVTQIGKVTFDVVPPSILTEQYVFKDECFKDQISLAQCLKEKSEFENRKIAEAIQKLYNESNNTVYVDREKLVMAGSIDGELKGLYDSCAKDLEGTKANLNEAQAKNSQLVDEKSKFDEFMKEQQQKADDEKKAINESAMQKLAHDKKVRNWTILGILGALLLISYVALDRHQSLKYNHKDTILP